MQLKKFSGWLLRNFKTASLGRRAAFTYKYLFSCKESAFFWAFLERALQMVSSQPSHGKDFQTPLMCGEMETLSAGLDLLEKVKTLFNFH